MTLELRRLVDGRLAMVAFTSIDALVEGCGAGQPWVGIPRHRLDEALDGAGVDLVLWDASPPPDQQRHRLPGGSLNELQANPHLWDLVHNGLRISTRNRATIGGRARRELALP